MQPSMSGQRNLMPSQHRIRRNMRPQHALQQVFKDFTLSDTLTVALYHSINRFHPNGENPRPKHPLPRPSATGPAGGPDAVPAPSGGTGPRGPGRLGEWASLSISELPQRTVAPIAWGVLAGLRSSGLFRWRVFGDPSLADWPLNAEYQR